MSACFRSALSLLGRVALLLPIAAFAAAFVFLGTAKGQEEPEFRYIDLVMLYEQGPSGDEGRVNYTVKNNGTATAVRVTVEFLLEDLETEDAELEGYDITGKETVGATNQRFRWVVGDIPPGGTSRGLLFDTTIHSGRLSEVIPGYKGRIGVINATASSSTPEPRALLANNNVKVYSYVRGSVDRTLHMKGNRLAVLLSADDLRPAAGGDVNFGLTADNENGAVSQVSDYINLIGDIDIRVTLSDGLEFDPGWTPPVEFWISGRSAAWTPDPVDSKSDTTANPALTRPYSREIQIQTRLTPNSLDDIPLEERCITAWVEDSTPPPSPDYALGRLKQCLGDDPTVLINSGKIDLLTVHHCVKVNNEILYPCRDSDGNSAIDNTLEMVVPLALPTLRAYGIGRFDPVSGDATETLLRPEFTVVQVKDPEGRRVSSGKIVWNSGSQSDADSDAAGLFPGAILDLSLPYDALTSKEYAFSIGDMTPGGKPGSMKAVAATITSIAVLDSDGTSFSGDTGAGDVPLWFEFGSLGIYKMNITIGHTEGSPSGLYTFHVGPIAELEARDGGASPAVGGGQRAFTIVAVNNGPDDAPAAQVTVTGLNANDYESHTATAGSFDPATGVWTIGELIAMDVSQSARNRDGEVLTIITSAASVPVVTAAISNTQDYQVCIDSSGSDVDAASEAACTATSGNTWHTTEYYDYIPGNNRATIQARPGTGEGHPDAARGLRVMETRVGNVLTWQPVASVNKFRLSHYEVQLWVSEWTPLANRVTGTVYLDAEGRANADYRVRAVNEFDQEGPWSISGRPPDMPGDFTVTLSESGNAVLSWTEPASPSPITGYVIDISDSPDGDSRTNDATVGGNVTTWTHTGLSPGDVKFYRVQARNRDGVGAWTDWQSVSSGPGAPGNLRARANGPNEIVLTWNEASSRDVTIYEYELEYSDTSASEGYEWNFLQTVLHDEGLRYVDNTVPQGTTRYYRVRARTLQGNVGGAWSNVASATTSAAGPSPPLKVAAEADGENRIRLTWEAPASGDAVRYNIEHSTDKGATWETERTGHTGTCKVGNETPFCYTDSGLLSGTEHWYRVAGVNGSGAAGEWSGAVSATTAGAATTPPGEPQNLRITSVSGRQVSLAWDAPMDDGGSSVTGYEYLVNGTCVHDPAQICQVIAPTRTGGTSVSVTVPNVRGQYDFYVRALNAAGAGWWTQPVSQYIDPQKNWRVTVSPPSLTVPENGQATYTVRLTSDPGKPVWVVLDWYGDSDVGEGNPEEGIPSLSEQQFKWLLPSNYASQNPDIYLDPEYTSPYNVGVAITVTAREDGDSENGTVWIANTVYYVPCAYLGNPSGCVDDPEDTGITAWVAVTERDND